MSVHSLASMDDVSYKGYEIDKEGRVTEFYDHTGDEGAESSLPGSHALSASRRLLSQPANSVATSNHVTKVRMTKAGCCDSCIGCFETIGRLPYASAFCLLFIWIGTGLFCGCGMALMDETLQLYKRYGPDIGNPATDAAPEYLYLGETMEGRYELRNKDDLGNLVPQVFESLKYSFYAIIPFMIFFSLILVIDGHKSTYELRHTESGCKSSSMGVCCSVSLLFISYWVLLFWIFFLCFTTLVVYYYRITMLRCFDLDDRGYTTGTQKDICLDLVQFGLVMFRDTTDRYRGKICGPGDSSRSTVGDLRGYCDNYYTAYRFSLLTFSGCFIVILGMIHAVMILSANYNNLKQKFMQPRRRKKKAISEARAATEMMSMPSPANTRRTHVSGRSGYTGSNGVPTVVAPTPRYDDLRPRRSSRDIELDYNDDNSRTSDYPPSNYTRQLDKNSHVGVDYYYRRY